MVAVAALTVAACGGGAGNGPTVAGRGEIDPAAVLRVASAGTAKNLDPYLQDTIGGWSYLTPLFDRLVMVDEHDKLIPGLATSWNFAPDGSHLDLTLRDDVTFNDGTPFTAEAVAANIHRGKTLEGSVAAAPFKSIVDVTSVDEHTARIALAPGSGVELPGLFSTNVGMMISPKAIAAGADIRNDPGLAGSGPYVVTKFVPSESLTMKRGDRTYWDPEVGRVGGIEIRTIPDASTRLNGMQTGALDVTWVSSASEVVQAQTLAQQGSFNIDKVPFRSTLGVYLQPQGALANPELRQAVAHAVDPESIRALYSGNCTPYRQIFPESSWASDPGYQYPYSFDPEKAKELVQKNGGARVSLTFGAGSNTEKPSNVIQAALTAAGFDADLNPVPLSQLEPRYIAGDFGQMVSNAFTPKMDPAETVNNYLLRNYAIAKGDPEVAGLAAKAADPTLSDDARAALYKEISARTLSEATWIPICHQTNATLYSNRIVNATSIPWVNTGIFDLRHVAMTR
ncbi:ABC transporter substrate-binding protein [Rhodococcus olei]|uniref:ABC transporter substrate-binding protein n=1 Tax=Rhodococcus olei TaxID=2161675 RepID=A0ABP8P4S2_9NOCA